MKKELVEKYENRLKTKHKNSEFREAIKQFKKKHGEWKVTVIFYEALHLISALFILKHKKEFDRHIEMKKAIKNEYPDLSRDYRKLFAYSRVARYTPESAKGDLIKLSKEHFKRIEDTVTKVLKNQPI